MLSRVLEDTVWSRVAHVAGPGLGFCRTPFTTGFGGVLVSWKAVRGSRPRTLPEDRRAAELCSGLPRPACLASPPGPKISRYGRPWTGPRHSHPFIHPFRRTGEPQLENVSLELWGATLRQPTTTFTSLLLALECWLLFRRLQPRGLPGWIPEDGDGNFEDGPHPWSGFFFFMGPAILFGAAKHGVPHYLAGLPLAATVFASSLAAGLATLHLEAATIRARVGSESLRRWLRRGALCKFAVFAVAIVANDSILLVVVDAALGLILVTVAEVRADRSGTRKRGRVVVGGLVFPTLAASAYILNVSIHAWFNHKDLAHVLMMVSLWVLYRGVRRPPHHPPLPGHGPPL